MALHLGLVNRETNMVDKACDHVCGMTVKKRCPGDPGGDICIRICSDCVI